MQTVYRLHASGLRFREFAEHMGVPIGSWLAQVRSDFNKLEHNLSNKPPGPSAS